MQANQHRDSAAIQKYFLQNPARVIWNQKKPPAIGPASGTAVLSNVQPEKKSISASGSQILAGPTCIDTSGRLVTTQNGWTLRPGGAITKLRDGSILVPGFHQQATTPYYLFPRLIKYDPAGNIIWAKVFDAPNVYPLNFASAYITFELNDGSILMAGEMEVPTVYNSREELILWKLDANGNTVWVQTDSSSIWAPNDGHLNVTGMAQDPAGNIYLCGNFAIQFSFPSGSFVSKMDPAGNNVWDRYFSCFATESYGLLWLENEISVYGVNPYVYAPDGSGLQTNELWNIKINPTTGDTVSTKCWYPDYGVNSSWYSLYGFGSVVQLKNGNIGISGTAESDNYMNTAPLIHGMATEFDPSFQFVRGWELASNMSGTTRITEHASGRISYGFFPNQAGYVNDNIFGSIEQGQVIKERIIHQQTLENNGASNFLNISGSEDIEIQTATDRVTVDGEQFIRLHDSDTSSVCTGIDTLVSWIQPYHMLPLSYFKCDSISNNTFRKTNRPIPAPSDGIMQQQSPCTLKSFCDSVKLFVNQSQVCAGQPALFTCRRNPECGTRPNWIFDTTNLQSDSILNDTTLQLIYKDQYQGKLSVSMNGTCKHLSDSIMFTVTSAGTPISLGPDGWLCPDSSVILRPAKGFAGYVWQDGSVADTMQVSAPGKYYVTVTNTCGLPASDTIVFQQAPALNFSVGPDTAYCFNDPVTLQAPAGYNGYSWKSNNNGNIYNTSLITVYPPVTTQYIASAKTALGCVVRDSILINIKMTDPVFLGNDTSFCTGDSILLNAGSSFVNYSWNTGASVATIRVSRQGSYSVSAQSANGCYSRDTISILKLFSLPDVKLDQNNWICEGSFRVLNAGSGYQSYLWQDGSGSSTLNVDTTGTYSVSVKDQNGCVGGDTVIITKIIPKSTDFLMTDTLICDGFPAKIQASTQYSDYSWSTGDQNNYIIVKKGGSYSLTVTDQYGCTSTSSVSVTTKQCVFGIFFPNAFSPNHDGHNDLFRPNVLGELTKYQLEIFNRWGQKVFESSDFTKGWEGKLGGTIQVSGVYVWLCHYQFEGEPEKTQNGTVFLLR